MEVFKSNNEINHLFLDMLCMMYRFSQINLTTNVILKLLNERISQFFKTINRIKK